MSEALCASPKIGVSTMVVNRAKPNSINEVFGIGNQLEAVKKA
jgi:hypothetical protein